jgi:hypothetical protein
MRSWAALAMLAACGGPGLRVARRVDVRGDCLREPMIVEHPGGAQFVAGYDGKATHVWRSDDGGASWRRVDLGPDANGNSDVDLAVAADGTIYFASMTYDRVTDEGAQIAVAASADAGATWTWRTVSRQRFDDRPWVAAAPDGTVHAIWNDGSGVSHASSADRGATWTAGPRAHDRGGSGHLAVGPRGQVAVHVTPASASGNKHDDGVELIAVSDDGGATWRTSPPPGLRPWPKDEERRWVEPLAWDERGSLYSFWTVGAERWLGRSDDEGATWTRWRLGAGGEDAYYPYLVARGGGELAATWFTGARDTGGLRWHAALIDARARDRAPRVLESPPLPIDAWGWKSDAGQDTGGEYLGVAFLRGGGIAVVTPIQHAAIHKLGFTWWKLVPRQR